MPLAEETVRTWIEELGLRVQSNAGIRIFHDYLPAAMRDQERLNDLLAVEREFRKQEPFASLGHHLHLICEWAR
jgi:S-adenosylmethionine-dependent methyltransferase